MAVANTAEGYNKKAKAIVKKNPVKSASIARNSLELSYKTNNKPEEANSHAILGESNYNGGNFADAKAEFEKAKTLYKAQKNEAKMQEMNTWISKCDVKLAELSKEKDLEKADVDKFNQAYGNYYNSTDSALNSIQLTRAYKTNNNDIEQRKAAESVTGQLLNGRTELASIDRTAYWQFSMATPVPTQNLVIGNKLLTYSLNNNNKELAATGKLMIGKALVTENKVDEAEAHLLQTIEFAEKNKDFDAAKKAATLLVELYEKNKQIIKAFEASKKLQQFSDSLQEYNLKNKAKELAQTELLAGQQDKINLLELAQKEKETRLSRQSIALWSMAVGLALLGFLIYFLWRNIRQKQQANYKIKLQSLRTQMNPHFIFNSLNSVNNFIAQNDERAANKYIADFSKLMRSVMANSAKEFIPLEEEILLIKIYMELEHARFKNKFSYSFEVKDSVPVADLEIPPMLIQPYIENAIWHGLRYKETYGLLSVKIFKNSQNLFCSITDDGIGREKSKEIKSKHQKLNTSTGMKNTAERIDILNKLYKLGLKIEVTDLENHSGTEVLITIPFKTKEKLNTEMQ